MRSLFVCYYNTAYPNQSNIYSLLLCMRVCVCMRVGDRESAQNAGDQEPQVHSLDQKYPLEEEVVTHSSILTWRILWKEEPGEL